MSSVHVSRSLQKPLWWADAMLLLVAVVWGASYGLAKGAGCFTRCLVFWLFAFV